MKTPTHFILGVGVAAVVKTPRFRRVAFVIGCGAPDMFVVGLFAFVTSKLALTSGTNIREGVAAFSLLYFDDPFCIAAHNLLHSPLSLAVLAMIVWRMRSRVWKNRGLSFLAGAGFHAAIDVAVHHDDGPLVLWPLDWSFRIESPVSHWDVAHYGGYVLAFEGAALVVALVLLLKADPWRLLGAIDRFTS